MDIFNWITCAVLYRTQVNCLFSILNELERKFYFTVKYTRHNIVVSFLSRTGQRKKERKYMFTKEGGRWVRGHCLGSKFDVKHCIQLFIVHIFILGTAVVVIIRTIASG